MDPGKTSQVQRSFRTAWLTEVRRVVWVLLIAAFAGWLWDALMGALLLGLAGLLAWHLRQLYLLACWSLRSKDRPLPDPGGLWGEVFDELYATQRRNRKRKRRLASIVSEFQASTAALPDGAVVISPEGRIAWFNSAAQSLLGLRSPQDSGSRINNLIRSPAFHHYFAQGDYEHDIEVPSPLNSQFALSLRVIPYGDGQRLLIIRDISEHKRLDRMRRDFVANASHELRTPLTVLTGYMEMMRPEAEREDSPLAPWRAPLEEMRNQLARMELLIADLLKLARLESEPFAPRSQRVDMREIIEECVRQAERLSQGQHRFEVRAADEPMLAGHSGELHSIVMNLLSNAVRYTPGGGTIRVRWEETVGDGGAQLTVADTGIGIPAADIPRLTERFYRVDVGRSRAGGGTGLGLAIVKHALELHEAHLEIDSAPGKGSRFRCIFPAARVRHRDEDGRRSAS